MLEVWWLSQSTARAYHLQDRALGRILSLFGLCPPWYQAGAQWRRSAQPTLEIHCFMAWHSTVQWKQWGMKLEEKWRNRRAGLNFDTFGVSTMLFFEYRELLNSQNTKSWHQILLCIIFCKKKKLKWVLQKDMFIFGKLCTDTFWYWCQNPDIVLALENVRQYPTIL